MTRFAYVLLITASLLGARENPFFPAKGMEDLVVTGNKDNTYAPLERASLSLPDSARVIKEVTIRYQNLDGSISTKTISLENSVDWHLPIFISQSYANSAELPKTPQARKTPSHTTVATFKEIAFDQAGKRLIIRTNDPLMRHFMMVKPHRIVMDFKRVTDFRSKSKTLSNAPYKTIRLGNHDGYYRAVIELDGQYQYTIDKNEKGKITLSVE